jgi:hypothetical protein
VGRIHFVERCTRKWRHLVLCRSVRMLYVINFSCIGLRRIWGADGDVAIWRRVDWYVVINLLIFRERGTLKVEALVTTWQSRPCRTPADWTLKIQDDCYCTAAETWRPSSASEEVSFRAWTRHRLWSSAGSRPAHYAVMQLRNKTALAQVCVRCCCNTPSFSVKGATDPQSFRFFTNIKRCYRFYRSMCGCVFVRVLQFQKSCCVLLLVKTVFFPP